MPGIINDDSLSSPNRKRLLAFDVIRVLACLSVCSSHVMNYSGFSFVKMNPEGYSSFAFPDYILECSPNITLFFMISGALMLPMRGTTGFFLKRRACKTGIPLLIWTLIYLIPAFHFNTPERFNLLLAQVPFTASIEYSFWFLYVLAGLYLLTPILSRWVTACSKKELGCYLLLWAAASLFPYVTHFNGLTIDITSPLYYFYGYAGYYVAGYYLSRYYRDIKAPVLLTLILTAFAINIAIPYLNGLLHLPLQTGLDDCEIVKIFTCSVVFLSVFYFFGERPSTQRWKILSQLTFGVYLVNAATLYMLPRLIPLEGVPTVARWMVWLGVTLAFSFSMVYVIGFIPGSKYLIGYYCCPIKIVSSIKVWLIR